MTKKGNFGGVISSFLSPAESLLHNWFVSFIIVVR